MKLNALLAVAVIGLGMVVGTANANAPARGGRGGAARAGGGRGAGVARGGVNGNGEVNQDSVAGGGAGRAGRGRRGPATDTPPEGRGRGRGRGAPATQPGATDSLQKPAATNPSETTAGEGARGGRGRAGRGDNGAADAGAGRGEGRGRGAGVDQRELNQKRRIEQGIKQGQLTPDEVTKLQGMEKNINDLEASYKSDGKLTRDEVQKLHKSLNDASLQIWSERHDTEGNQKAAMVLGKDVFATDALTSKLESENLTGVEAKAFAADFHKLVTMKRRLGSDNLTPEVRSKLQSDYNDLLNQYFIIK